MAGAIVVETMVAGAIVAEGAVPKRARGARMTVDTAMFDEEAAIVGTIFARETAGVVDTVGGARYTVALMRLGAEGRDET
jgi:hypothetical protein